MTNSARVNAYYGEAHPFWDVCFTEDQAAYAGVVDDDLRRISVTIDADTGKVELNAGYAPGSPPYKDETRFFGEFEDAIVEALVGEVPENDERYAAFLQRARQDAEGRRERLADLAGAIDDEE